MADKFVRIDPDNTGSPNYLSTSAAITGELAANPDLTAMAGKLYLELDSGAGSADTTGFTINGFTTSALYNIILRPYPGQEHAGIFDATKARYDLSDANIYNNEPYTELQHTQIKHLNTTGTNYTWYGQAGPAVINECIFDTHATGGTVNAIYANGDHTVTNTLIYYSSGSLARAYYKGTVNSVIENCTFKATGYVLDVTAAVLVKNTVAYGGSINFRGTYASGSDYNADSGDSTAPGTNSIHNVASTDFNNLTSFDFSLSGTSSHLYHAGTPISGLTTDIVGNAWDATTPSIGAFEYISATFNPAIALMANQ